VVGYIDDAGWDLTSFPDRPASIDQSREIKLDADIIRP